MLELSRTDPFQANNSTTPQKVTSWSTPTSSPRGWKPKGDRLSRLSQASLRVNESLDVDTAMRAEFLGMLSHELRMPLTTIMRATTTLLNATADLDPVESR